MTPLPKPDASGTFIAWRLERAGYEDKWDEGVGPFLNGGRWTPERKHAVYASVDPATAILEVAANAGLYNLDTAKRTLIRFSISLAHCKVIWPVDVPNPNWLVPGNPTTGQQAFGQRAMADRGAVLIPSVVSSQSWNVYFDPAQMTGWYEREAKVPFALDPRLQRAA